jgi:hypothetical protein
VGTEQEDAFEQWLTSLWELIPPEDRFKWIPPRTLAKKAFNAGWEQGFDEANGKQNDDE